MQRENASVAIHAAMAEIETARARLFATGAVDVESSVLDALASDLQSGAASPDEVIARVRKMIDARSEYH